MDIRFQQQLCPKNILLEEVMSPLKFLKKLINYQTQYALPFHGAKYSNEN